MNISFPLLRDLHQQWIEAKYKRKEFINGADRVEYTNGMFDYFFVIHLFLKSQKSLKYTKIENLLWKIPLKVFEPTKCILNVIFHENIFLVYPQKSAKLNGDLWVSTLLSSVSLNKTFLSTTFRCKIWLDVEKREERWTVE